MKSSSIWLAIALAIIVNGFGVNGIGIARADLTSFTVGPDSPNYLQLLEFAQTIHPDDFGLKPREGSATAVRYELKFRPRRGESISEFVDRLEDLKNATAEAFPGGVGARDEIKLGKGETAANVTDIFPKMKLVVYVDPKTKLLVTADRVQEALARPKAYKTAELGILPRARVYGLESEDGIRISKPGAVWVDLKGKRFTDPRIVDKPRAAFSIADLRRLRFDKPSDVRRRMSEIVANSKAIGGSKSAEAPEVLEGFLLIRSEYYRQFRKPYVPDEGYLTHRSAWVVEKTLIQATQDRLYRRTEPMLEPLLRAGDLSPMFRPVVLDTFEEDVFSEFKFSPKDIPESRDFRKLLRKYRFDMSLASASQGKRLAAKKREARLLSAAR